MRMTWTAVLVGVALHPALLGAAADAQPLRFVPDDAAADLFVARGPRYAVRVGAGGAEVVAGGETFRVGVVDADGAARPSVESPQPGRVHVLRGRDARAWRPNQQPHGRVRFQSVYPGVDVAYYGRDGWLEQDFIVSPGADWRRVSLSLSDAAGLVAPDRLRIDDTGALVVSGPAGFRLDAPVAYQDATDGRHTVAVAYRLDGPYVRFEVGDHDPRRELVIDPVVSHAAFLGGNLDDASAVALDVQGDVYVAGVAASPSGGTDAFLARYSGGALVYATYLGGGGDEAATGVAVRPSGEIDLVGTTSSANFPVSSTALQPAAAGGLDSFVTRLDASGGYLLYSSYLGGGGADAATAVAHGLSPDVFVAGHTDSSAFPTTASVVQPAAAGGTDAFLSRLRPSGGIADIHTFLETCPTDDPAIERIRADFSIWRNAALVTSFPCTSPVSAMPLAQWTDELIVLQALRVAYHMDYGQPGLLPWTAMTFYNWLKSQIDGFNIDDTVPGPSCCGTFGAKTYITLPDSTDSARDFARGWRGLSVRISLFGHEARHLAPGLWTHTTCCPAGGNCDDLYDESQLSPHGIQRWLDARWLNGDIYVGFACTDAAAVTEIAQWHQATAQNKDGQFCAGTLPPVPMPLQPGGPCPRPVPMTLAYSSYLGGQQSDRALALRVSGTHDAFLAGRTSSVDFPTTPNAYQPVLAGTTDAFVTRLYAAPLRPPVAPTYSTYFGGSGFDEAAGLALGPFGEMVLVGRTTSVDFPVSAAALQPSLSGASDGFVTRLRIPGTPLPPLAFSTYFGGSSNEGLTGVARDDDGFVFAGWTTSSDMPATNPFQSRPGGGTDALVGRLASDGGLVWSSYLGGAALDRARGIVHRGSRSWIVGQTYSADFPTTVNVPVLSGSSDGFVSTVDEP